MRYSCVCNTHVQRGYTYPLGGAPAVFEITRASSLLREDAEQCVQLQT